MNPQMIMGLFAFAVAGASLVRHLNGGVAEQGRGSVWERSRLKRIQFLGHVAVPLLVGTVFLSYGIVRTPSTPPEASSLYASLMDHSRAYLEILSRAKPDTAPLAWSELSLPSPDHGMRQTGRSFDRGAGPSEATRLPHPGSVVPSP